MEQIDLLKLAIKREFEVLRLQERLYFETMGVYPDTVGLYQNILKIIDSHLKLADKKCQE